MILKVQILKVNQLKIQKTKVWSNTITIENLGIGINVIYKITETDEEERKR